LVICLVALLQGIQGYPDTCYNTDATGQCGKEKKPCPEDSLRELECTKPGMKKKLFHDQCGCPKLICTGCALENGPIDVQIILDSSSSMAWKPHTRNWKLLIGQMRNFIDSLMTHKDSRMAIARFGTHSQILTDLETGINASFLDDYTAFKDMGTTHLGEALQRFLRRFIKKAGLKGSDASARAPRFLFVITDGKANGPVDVAEAAAKWKDAVDHIYALGFGDADKEDLAKITDEEANIIMHPKLEDLFEDINEHVIPKVCKSGPVDVEVTECAIEDGPFDVQVILDSSSSIGWKNWKSIIGEMKKFIDSLMTHKDSRIAIGRFGTHVGRLTKLKTGIQGSFLDKYTAFKDMGTTHLGEALQSSFEKFNEIVVKSPNPHAKRFLFVITDGKANGPLDVAEEAAKWKGIVDHIFALGFGTADKEGLAKITDEDANIIIHPKLDDLFKDIKEHITPKVCKSGQ